MRGRGNYPTASAEVATATCHPTTFTFAPQFIPLRHGHKAISDSLVKIVDGSHFATFEKIKFKDDKRRAAHWLPIKLH